MAPLYQKNSFIIFHSKNVNLDPFFSDDTAHVDNVFSNQSLTFDTIKTITGHLSKLKLPVVPILGNHDAYPHNQFSDDPYNSLYQETAILWNIAGFLDEEAYEEYKENGGFYSTEIGPFLLVGLNSNLWYRSNKEDCDDVGNLV